MSLLSELVEPFENLQKWTVATAGSASASIVTNQLKIAMPASATSSSNGSVTSIKYYDLTASQAVLEIIEVPDQTKNTVAELILESAYNSNIGVKIKLELGTLAFQRSTGGGYSDLDSITWSSIDHKYWRIREYNGSIYFETSHNSYDWTTQISASWSLMIAIDRMYTKIVCRCTSSVTNAGSFVVDNLNVLRTGDRVKRFFYKIYTSSGQYLGNWNDEVTSEPVYTQEMNLPSSEMVITLARPPEEFGEEDDVSFDNIVKVYVQDYEYAEPVVFFQGRIVSYKPIYGANEGVQVTVYSSGDTLDRIIYRLPGAVDQTQDTGTSSITFGGDVVLAQSFIPSQPTLKYIDVYLGTPSSLNVTLKIHSNNSGAPSALPIANGSSSKTINNSSVTFTRFIFDTPPTLTTGQTYWMVLTS